MIAPDLISTFKGSRFLLKEGCRALGCLTLAITGRQPATWISDSARICRSGAWLCYPPFRGKFTFQAFSNSSGPRSAT